MRLEKLVKRLEEQFPHIYFLPGEGRRRDQALLNKINRMILSRLEARDLIEKEKSRRNVLLRLTELGEFFALLG
jgi:hypothetical protein